MLETQSCGYTAKGAAGNHSLPLIKSAVSDKTKVEPTELLPGDSSAPEYMHGWAKQLERQEVQAGGTVYDFSFTPYYTKT